MNGFGFGAPSYPFCPAPYFAYAPPYFYYGQPQQNLGFFDTILQAFLVKKGIQYPDPPTFVPVPIPQPVYYPPPPPPAPPRVRANN